MHTRKQTERQETATGVGTTPIGPVAGDGGETASDLIDIKQLARMLKRGVSTLYRDRKAGRIPAPVKVGGSTRWRRDEVKAWMNRLPRVQTSGEESEP